MRQHLLDPDIAILVLGRDDGMGGQGLGVGTADSSHDAVFLFVRVHGAIVFQVLLQRSIGVDGRLCSLLAP